MAIYLALRIIHRNRLLIYKHKKVSVKYTSPQKHHRRPQKDHRNSHTVLLRDITYGSTIT